MLKNKPVVFRVTNNLNIGGVQRRLRSLLPLLTKDFEVHVVTYKDKGIFFSELEELGVKTHFLPLKGKWDPVGIYKLSSLFKKYGADIVHTHSLGGNISGILAASLAGVKVKIANVHLAKLHWYASSWIHKKKQALEENIIHLLFTDKILFVSKEALDFYLKNSFGLKNKILILHNGLEVDLNNVNRGLREKIVTNNQQKIIGFVGRIAKGKGLDFFIDSALKVLEQDKNFLFLIVGGGNIEYWQSKIPSFAKEHFVFTGEVKDVNKYYSVFDLLFFTSEPGIEGMPGVVLEAGFWGLPILARYSKCIEEIKEYYPRIRFIDSNCSILENIQKALSLPAANTEKLEQEFSLEAMYKRTKELYLSLLCA